MGRVRQQRRRSTSASARVAPPRWVPHCRGTRTPALPSPRARLLNEGEIVLDVRPGDEFAAGHVPGSVNIALEGQFASWAGTVLGLSSHPVLIAGPHSQLEEARLRLARVGIEVLDGYLEGGV